MIKKVAQNLQPFPANEKQWPAALTNNKQEKADNAIKRSGVRLNWKKYKKRSTNLKNCRVPFLGLDLSMRFNKTPIHFVTQSLYVKVM